MTTLVDSMFRCKRRASVALLVTALALGIAAYTLWWPTVPDGRGRSRSTQDLIRAEEAALKLSFKWPQGEFEDYSDGDFRRGSPGHSAVRFEWFSDAVIEDLMEAEWVTAIDCKDVRRVTFHGWARLATHRGIRQATFGGLTLASATTRPDFGAFALLTHVSLRNCDIDQELVRGLSTVRNLTFIALDSCRLTRAALAGLPDMDPLRGLRIWNCRSISDETWELPDLPSVELLDLWGTWPSADRDLHFEHWTELKILIVANLSCSNTLAPRVFRAPKLQKLQLNGMLACNAAFLRSLAGVVTLRQLVIEHIRLDYEQVSALLDVTQLRVLRLVGCDVSESLVAMLAQERSECVVAVN